MDIINFKALLLMFLGSYDMFAVTLSECSLPRSNSSFIHGNLRRALDPEEGYDVTCGYKRVKACLGIALSRTMLSLIAISCR